jgi:DNA-binding transcriptional ArsR family regulator
MCMKKHEEFQKQNRLLLLFKVLANSNRLKIAKLLVERAEKGATSGEIAQIINSSESNISNHLKLMRISKVLKAKQSGLNMHYFIKDDLVKYLLSPLK